jgi:D-arabinose 1-dehydrogenase-like Zn-dependent alcohol dehydrogenase
MGFLMAKSLACNVFVTSGSEDKIKKSVSLGATKGYNYKSDRWLEEIKEDKLLFDVILDGSGGAAIGDLIPYCNYAARVSIYGAGQGEIKNINPFQIFWKQISILGSSMGSDLDFKHMLEFVSKHNIKPIVSEVIDISKYQKGFKLMEEAGQFGKIVFKNSF